MKPFEDSALSSSSKAWANADDAGAPKDNIPYIRLTSCASLTLEPDAKGSALPAGNPLSCLPLLRTAAGRLLL